MAQTDEQLKDLTLKDLQQKLTDMDFEGAEFFTSKDQAIAVIRSLEKKSKVAAKAIDTANEPFINDNVREDAKHYAGKAAKMKEKLEKQPKVPYAIPLGIGEKKGAYETVQMNGYRLSILKGVIVHLPQQVVQLLMDAYTETQEAGSQFLMDRNEEVKNKLS